MFAKHLLRTGALTAAAATIGSIASKDAESRWYRSLDKPPFQPPAVVFPVVWTALYADIALVSAAVLNTWEQAAERADRSQPHVEPAPGHPAGLPSHAVLHGHGHGADVRRSHHRQHAAAEGRGGQAGPVVHHQGQPGQAEAATADVAAPAVDQGPASDQAPTSGRSPRREQRRSRRHRPDPGRAARAARNGYRFALVRNMALNAAWSWVFFKGRNPAAATGVAALLAADTWALTRRAGEARPGLGAALVPYAAWCSFATLLSGSIWARNPKA